MKPKKIRGLTIVERINHWTTLDVKTDCWLWQGALNDQGYGVITIEGRNTRVHRVQYEEWFGPIPKGMLVCHRCDVRKCCNPRHLFLGTHKDNLSDMSVKGRSCRGQKNGQAKITPQIVEAIRSEYVPRPAGPFPGLKRGKNAPRGPQEGSQAFLSAKFGISRAQVGRILSKQRWA